MTNVRGGPATGRTNQGIAWEADGRGDPLVLLHAGIADRRMWDPQWAAFAGRYRVIRYDARGFGESGPPDGPWAHHRDLAGLLDELDIRRAHLLGASLGAGTAVELALDRQAAVASLVLVAPGGALFTEPTAELRDLWRAEGAAVRAGDLDAAVEVNLRGWVDGPQRPPSAVDPETRAAVAAMQRRAFEVATWDDEAAPEEALEPPAGQRLGELSLPVLALAGDEDQPIVTSVARRIRDEVAGARVETWPGVAHLPSLERPDAFERLVLDFLAAHPIDDVA